MIGLRHQIEQWQREEREALEREIDRNCRLLELSRHNGFGADVRDSGDGRKVWLVPPQMLAIVGYMGAVVRP